MSDSSTPQPCFLRPKSRPRGLFFMHIPKTAGSFVVDLFRKRLGWRACAPFLEGEILHALGKGAAMRPRRADFASAHTSLVLLRRAGIAQEFDLFTVLRDPLARLASHLNWMDRFNHGLDRPAYQALSPSAKRLVQQLDATDPDSLPDMKRLFRLDELAKGMLFFNMQAAMIAPRSMTDMLDLADMRTLSEADLRRVIDRLSLCCMLEDLTAGLRAAGHDLPGTRVNRARTRRFLPDATLRSAAARFLEVDMRLVDLVRSDAPDLGPVLAHLDRRTADAA